MAQSFYLDAIITAQPHCGKLMFPVVCVSVCLSFCLFDTHKTIGSSHGTTPPSPTGHVHYVACSLGKRAVGIGLKYLLVNLEGVLKTSLALISLIVLYLFSSRNSSISPFPTIRFFVYQLLVQLSSKLHNLPKRPLSLSYYFGR